MAVAGDPAPQLELDAAVGHLGAIGEVGQGERDPHRHEAELVVQVAADRVLQRLVRARVATARVGPHTRERALALGFSGAWIGNLTALEPYRPLFLGTALLALFFAGRRIFRPAQVCKPGEVCAIPQVRATYKLIFWVVALLVLVALGFPYVMPFFY